MKIAKQLLALSALLVVLSRLPANAAIQAQATRVIYNSENAAATLSLKNNSDKPYMVQTWLTSGKDNQKVPMVVIPPLLKLDSGKESILRFIYSGQGLPVDQESLFWVNIQEIPPKPDQDNVLQIAIRSKIKLFYRPKEIKISLDEAARHLQWYQEGKQLKVQNTSPLHVTIGVIKDDQGKTYSDLNNDMVAPNQSITVLNNFSGNAQSITYTYINDYGGATTISLVKTK